MRSWSAFGSLHVRRTTGSIFDGLSKTRRSSRHGRACSIRAIWRAATASSNTSITTATPTCTRRRHARCSRGPQATRTRGAGRDPQARSTARPSAGSNAATCDVAVDPPLPVREAAEGSRPKGPRVDRIRRDAVLPSPGEPTTRCEPRRCESRRRRRMMENVEVRSGTTRRFVVPIIASIAVNVAIWLSYTPLAFYHTTPAQREVVVRTMRLERHRTVVRPKVPRPAPRLARKPKPKPLVASAHVHLRPIARLPARPTRRRPSRIRSAPLDGSGAPSMSFEHHQGVKLEMPRSYGTQDLANGAAADVSKFVDFFESAGRVRAAGVARQSQDVVSERTDAPRRGPRHRREPRARRREDVREQARSACVTESTRRGSFRTRSRRKTCRANTKTSYSS